MKPDNLIGNKYGMLTVIEKGESTKRGKLTWKCRCDCGNIKKKSVNGYDLKSGKVKSCGCYYSISNARRNVTHGDTSSRLYRIWQGVKARCYRKSTKEYAYYGGKGINVCKDWLEYLKFKEWAYNNGYSDKLTLDRIDNNKGYFPDNCRWVSYTIQARNRSNNRVVNVNQEEHTLSEWSEISGINAATIAWRLDHGWNEDELFMKPNYNNKNIRRKFYE